MTRPATAITPSTTPIARPKPLAEPLNSPHTSKQTTQSTLLKADQKSEAELAEKTGETFDFINVFGWGLDSVLRGFLRYAESFAPNTLARVGVRGLSEGLRKGTEIVGMKYARGEKATASDFKTAVVRMVENTAASAFLEPNMSTNRFARLFMGFGNMMLRFMTRGVMFAANIIDKTTLELEALPDQLISRSLPRLITTVSEDPKAQIGVRIFEQMVINPLNAWEPVNKIKAFMKSRSQAA